MIFYLCIYPSGAELKTEGSYVCVCVCMCVYRESFILHVFIYLFVHLSACLFIYLSTVRLCLSYSSMGWPVYLFIFIFAYLLVCLFLDW